MIVGVARSLWSAPGEHAARVAKGRRFGSSPRVTATPCIPAIGTHDPRFRPNGGAGNGRYVPSHAGTSRVEASAGAWTGVGGAYSFASGSNPIATSRAQDRYFAAGLSGSMRP